MLFLACCVDHAVTNSVTARHNLTKSKKKKIEVDAMSRENKPDCLASVAVVNVSTLN